MDDIRGCLLEKAAPLFNKIYMITQKILILGSTGFLGSKIIEKAPKNLELWLGYKDESPKNNGFKKVKLVLQDFDLLKKQINQIKPQTIIHAARIEPFEEDPVQTKRIMDKFVEVIKPIGARLIYISSDAVFDGQKGDYKEGDATNPVTEYGRAKLAAEIVIRNGLNNFNIIRTSYLYGKSDNKWDKRTTKLIEKIKDSGELSFFNDMHRSPTSVDDLADACWKLVYKNFSGIIHVAGLKKSILQFNREIAERLGIDHGSIRADSIRKATLNIAPDTSLNTNLAEKIIGFLPESKIKQNNTNLVK